MAENPYIVEMRHITKHFPGIVANDDVTISVKKGEIYALLGENGAGKSTLMSMLFGMYEPDEGQILIRGKEEKIESPSYAAGLNIGMVHQHFKLVSNYTIAENIVLGMEPMKKAVGIFPYVDMKSANREVAELSKQYGLEVNPTDVISDVNVSTRQRVEILKMLYRKAEILIFDEPTAVLTPQEIQSLLQIIRNLRDGGKTIILITHKLPCRLEGNLISNRSRMPDFDISYLDIYIRKELRLIYIKIIQNIFCLVVNCTGTVCYVTSRLLNIFQVCISKCRANGIRIGILVSDYVNLFLFHKQLSFSNILIITIYALYKKCA